MDVVMCHQAGTQNTVAVSGTAFTSEQISLIKRLTKKIAFCFDSDSAGLSALKRSAQLALLSDMDVYVINIPSAKDPAELIQENADIWHETIKNKQHIISYLLEKSHIEITDERTRIARVTKDVMPLLASMQDKIDQSFFIKETSSDLRVPYESVESSMKTLGNHDLYQAENYQKDESESKSENIFDKRFEKVMEELVGLLYLVDNDSRNKYSSEIDIILRESNFGIKSLSDIPEEVINKYSIHAEKLYTDDKKRLLEIEKIKLNLEELSLETQLNAFNTLGNLEQGSADKTLKDKLLIAKRLDIIRKKRHTHQ